MLGRSLWLDHYITDVYGFYYDIEDPLLFYPAFNFESELTSLFSISTTP